MKKTPNHRRANDIIDVVMRQVHAYNDHDIDAFCATFDDDVVLYWHPNQIRNEGIEGLRSQYSRLFSECPNVRARIQYQQTIGDKVLLEEVMSDYWDEPDFSAFVIYEVRNELIRNVWFIKD